MRNIGQEYDEKAVERSQALKGIMRWVKLHPYNISQKVQIVVEHFRENVAPLLDGQAKAMVVVGSRLEAVRCERGLTKAALARLIQVTPRAVAAIESGGQARIQTVEALAQALGISPAWLAFNQGPRVLPRTRRGGPVAQSSATVG